MISNGEVDGWTPLVPGTHGRFGKNDSFGADFGFEYDLGHSYGYSDNLWLFVAYSVLQPDDGITGGSGAADDVVVRIYGGAYLKFPAKKET